MSGTRSASPMAPAINANPTALIVSHGQPSNPAQAEIALRKLADQVMERLPDWTIGSATMAAKGALRRARQQHPDAPVYPLFMADGWFTGTALPEQLVEGDRHRLLPPLGMDQRLPILAIEILTRELADRGWEMSETCLIIAAHGGKTSKNPAKAAQGFAYALRERSNFSDIRVGFLEECPKLYDVAAGAPEHSICLPFFAANGRHVREDIPEALSQAKFRGGTLAAIGHAAQIPDLIAQSLVQTTR